MTRRLPLLLIVVLTACGGGSARSVNGTARMADTLAILTAAMRADPMAVPFLNRARASMFEAATSGPQGMQNRYLAAQERLLAGDTREAIAALEQLVADAKIQLDASAPQNKAFFDLLGMS